MLSWTWVFSFSLFNPGIELKLSVLVTNTLCLLTGQERGFCKHLKIKHMFYIWKTAVSPPYAHRAFTTEPDEVISEGNDWCLKYAQGPLESY